MAAKKENDGEMVSIRLFSDNGRYKGDLFVSVNGVNYQIKRGVTVQVPPEVAEVIQHGRPERRADGSHHRTRGVTLPSQRTQNRTPARRHRCAGEFFIGGQINDGRKSN